MATLVGLVGTGDRDAMAELHRELHGNVLATAFAVVRDHGLAEDVAQEVFVWVWGHAHLFDARRGTVGAWIGTIARRRAIDAVRREVTWRSHCQLDLPADAADRHLADWERREVLRASMTSLSPGQRDALTTAFLGDHSYSQTAEILELKVCTLKSRIHEGLVAMRLVLDAPGA